MSLLTGFHLFPVGLGSAPSRFRPLRGRDFTRPWDESQHRGPTSAFLCVSEARALHPIHCDRPAPISLELVERHRLKTRATRPSGFGDEWWQLLANGDSHNLRSSHHQAACLPQNCPEAIAGAHPVAAFPRDAQSGPGCPSSSEE